MLHIDIKPFLKNEKWLYIFTGNNAPIFHLTSNSFKRILIFHLKPIKIDANVVSVSEDDKKSQHYNVDFIFSSKAPYVKQYF